MPATPKAQKISQSPARMAIQLPDPQAKILIVSETPMGYQCCSSRFLRRPLRMPAAWRAAGLESADADPASLVVLLLVVRAPFR